MSLDPELKALLSTLVTGQIKIAEGHERLEATVKHLATTTETALSRLAESQDRTDATVNRLGEKVDRFGERVDSFTKVIMEGFTGGVSRDRHIEDDLRALEARVTKLEHAPTPG